MELYGILVTIRNTQVIVCWTVFSLFIAAEAIIFSSGDMTNQSNVGAALAGVWLLFQYGLNDIQRAASDDCVRHAPTGLSTTPHFAGIRHLMLLVPLAYLVYWVSRLCQ